MRQSPGRISGSAPGNARVRPNRKAPRHDSPTRHGNTATRPPASTGPDGPAVRSMFRLSGRPSRRPLASSTRGHDTACLKHRSRFLSLLEQTCVASGCPRHGSPAQPASLGVLFTPFGGIVTPSLLCVNTRPSYLALGRIGSRGHQGYQIPRSATEITERWLDCGAVSTQARRLREADDETHGPGPDDGIDACNSGAAVTASRLSRKLRVTVFPYEISGASGRSVCENNWLARWTWTAPATGPVTFYTESSDSGLLLTVLDLDGIFQDEVRFNAQQRQEYVIFAWRTNNSNDPDAIVLNWRPSSSEGGSRASNDDFDASVAISGARGRSTGGNVGAGKESGEDYHAGDRGGASVWWTWTAPATGTVTFDTLDSDFDTLLAVYTRPPRQLPYGGRLGRRRRLPNRTERSQFPGDKAAECTTLRWTATMVRPVTSC